MAGDEEFSEEYIAELLKKDAQKVSASYARSGIYDVLPKRPTGTAPKPNTRFLQNIIRSTDSHNAALKQKELGDAASKLRALARNGGDNGHNHSRYEHTTHHDERRESGRHKRKRDHQQDELDNHRESGRSSRSSKRRSSEKSMRHSSEYHAKERRRSNHHSRQKDSRDARSEREEESYHRSTVSTDTELRERSPKKSKKQHSSRDHRNNENGSRHDPASMKHHDGREKNGHRHRHRSYDRSQSPAEEHRHSRSHKKQSMSPTIRSPSLKSSDSDSHKSRKISKSNHAIKQSSHSHHTQNSNRRGKHGRRRTPSPSLSPTPNQNQDQDLSDDPLTPFLGPQPPTQDPIIRVRGRGATSILSGTNQRFSASYDPATDVTLDNPDENEDWDQALEALRDRQQFRQVGIERLLAAGFSKDEVTRMERGGEKDGADVRWTKKGQAREWDRGKVLDEDGNVSFDTNRLGSEL